MCSTIAIVYRNSQHEYEKLYPQELISTHGRDIHSINEVCAYYDRLVTTYRSFSTDTKLMARVFSCRGSHEPQSGNLVIAHATMSRSPAPRGPILSFRPSMCSSSSLRRALTARKRYLHDRLRSSMRERLRCSHARVFIETK